MAHHNWATATVTTLQRLQRRFDRLRDLNKRLVLPASAYFVACGLRFNLPLGAKAASPCKRIPQRTLEYLAGFFDGDGCVSSGDAKRKHAGLQVHQVVSGGQVLLLFRNCFGGGIYARPSTGLHQPVLEWYLHGPQARHAASLLATVSSCKQSQLHVASIWPKNHSERADSVTALRELKHKPPGRAVCPSWAYLAGFFDADGCVSARYPSSLVLIIDQKLPDILYAIRDFLLAAGIHCQVAMYVGTGRLTISKTESSKYVLTRMLSAGLRAKREAARAALTLNRQNFHNVREVLVGIVGRQSRYKRLTPQGLQRSAAISCLKRKLRARTPFSDKFSDLEQELQDLKLEHARWCAMEGCELVRKDIRSRLAKGATVTPVMQ